MVDTNEVGSSERKARTFRVVIVDEDAQLRGGLAEMLAGHDDIAVVGTAGSAREALPLILKQRPDLVVLDPRLPEGEGIATFRELRSSAPGLRGLLLTSFDDDEAVLATVLAGATDYQVKQIGGSSVADGVRRVGRGESALDPGAGSALLSWLRRSIQTGNGSAILTEDEQRVLDLVGLRCTDREIADQLAMTESAVQSHVRAILAKLGSRRSGSGHASRRQHDRQLAGSGAVGTD